MSQEELNPVEETKEVSPEETARIEENTKNFNILKNFIEGAVEEMFKLEIPLAHIEVDAPTLFKNYARIRTSKTKQFSEFLKEKNAAEEKFYGINANQLEFLGYDTETQTEIDPEAV